tara:strand:+ start:886 stop:1461 length:576 start_codon:yes stop_codon:yes gene_type:complete
MPRPDKQIFYEMSFKDINKNSYNEVIDICCGKMNVYKKINNLKNYTGIDFDKEMIEIGIKKYPEVTAIIDKFENYNTDKKYDLAICFQTIGMNKDFNHKAVISFLEKIKNLISDRGYLAINFGPLVLENAKQDVLSYINENFKILNKYSYGGWYNRYSYLIFKIIYYLIKLFPFIKSSKVNQHIYFFLQKK